MFCAMVSRKRVSAWRCSAIEPMPGCRLDRGEQRVLFLHVVGDVDAGQPRPIHHLVERIDVHEGGEAEVALDDVGHRDLACPAPPLENVHLDDVPAPQVQDLGDPLVDDEAGRRQLDCAVVEIEDAGEVHVLGLADDGELARQVPVAQAHGHRPVGLGAQHARHALDTTAGRVRASRR